MTTPHKNGNGTAHTLAAMLAGTDPVQAMISAITGLSAHDPKTPDGKIALAAYLSVLSTSIITQRHLLAVEIVATAAQMYQTSPKHWNGTEIIEVNLANFLQRTGAQFVTTAHGSNLTFENVAKILDDIGAKFTQMQAEATSKFGSNNRGVFDQYWRYVFDGAMMAVPELKLTGDPAVLRSKIDKTVDLLRVGEGPHLTAVFKHLDSLGEIGKTETASPTDVIAGARTVGKGDTVGAS